MDIGDTFGDLTIVEFKRVSNGRFAFRIDAVCSCTCGNIKIAENSKLTKGFTKHCGCKTKINQSIGAILRGATYQKHRLVNTPTYYSWAGMKSRCLNKNNSRYKDYGGMGITICERWLNFNNFLADMGLRPNDKTLDRINVNGNYEPTNCRWATKSEQANNKRK